jgi:hypothetical protein
MKNLMRIFLLVGIFIILNEVTTAQSPSGWSMSAIGKHVTAITQNYKDYTWYFNKHDTIHFYLNGGKTIVEEFSIEIVLLDKGKEVSLFTTTEKNLNSSKTQIIIPIDDVYRASPGNSKISNLAFRFYIKDKKSIKEKGNFKLRE